MSDQKGPPLPEEKPPGQPFWRQLDIVDPGELQTPIVVVGAGAIGSMATLALAKMGCRRLTVYDHDTVEDHNWPNQYYGLADIGRPKVEALESLIRAQTGVAIKPVAERYEAQRLSGIVIAAVDSMAVRAQIWRSVKLKPAVELFVDGRMGAQAGSIFAVNPIDPDDIRRYEAPEVLYPDEKANEGACTNRAIIYNVMVLGGLIADVVKKFVRRERFPWEIQIDLHNLMLLTLER